ncbi:MAG: NAD-dependent succinate-semialdehyde dehydrogenase [Leptolyngbya sp. SIO4C1]|nr:NAD-dependent succinate-semialdehyde dehydrogenase [Leptolyngbya sp. SIO4C1]
MAIASINPATGEKSRVFESLSPSEMQQKLDLAADAFISFRQTSFAQRAAWFKAAGDILEARKAAFGRLMTLEMGKPLSAAIAEANKCAWVCRHYAEQAETYLADESHETDGSRSFIRYQPLGVLLAVMPWNFPFWQVFRFAAPSLMAGNVALLKHASNVPQCALAIEQIFTEAGFPKGAFQTLLITAEQTATVINDERVRAVSLTGSGPAGASVASAAAKQIKKAVLELGGSDPFIVTPSADLDAAVEVAVAARLQNNGQSCIAAKRFILVGEIADAFEQRLAEKFKALKVGDPLADETDIGPLATPAILHDIDQQVRDCLSAGATALVGGDPSALRQQLPETLKSGNFYPPTILTQIPSGTPADQEEFFGPVALIFRVDSLEAAIALANATPFGLGASAWTQNADEQARLINEIEAGAVFINGMVKSDPRIPFGGIKQSGFGRELGRHGILEFVNAKTVWVK